VYEWGGSIHRAGKVAKIAHVYSCGAHTVANGALIAAAPDLLAALQSAADYMELWTVEAIPDPSPGSLEALATQVRAAIGRAVLNEEQGS